VDLNAVWSGVPKIDLAVVLCTYNRAPRLTTALRSLERVQIPQALNWTLVTVDNNSTDETTKVLDETMSCGALPIHRMFTATQGKAHALNHALDFVRDIASVVAFTDDDVEYSPQWLGELWHAFDDPAVMGVGGRILSRWPASLPKPDWYDRSLHSVIIQFDKGNTRRPLKTPPWGPNMAYRQAIFQQVGGFNTELGPVGRIHRLGVDVEFGQRVLDRGLRIDYVPSAIVYHPVYPEQVTKRYFLHWYYERGKFEVKVSDLTGHRLLGVPRHFVRLLIANMAAWLLSRGPSRFHYKLECTHIWGKIVEAFRRRCASPARDDDRA
jgi:cellulose synthase/poly-beta-1,6-N-acetylglucosamine synthase-like glycosyltransferase